ncbi:MAG: tetratricopeptide repeat protein [Wenzhouxiangellaceae bacterium]
MNGTRVSAIGLVFILNCLPGAPIPDARAAKTGEWIEVSTENFIIRTNTGREKAVELATDLEKYRFLVIYLTGVQAREVPGPPLLVHAFATTREYHDHTGMTGTLGAYASKPSGAVSLLSLEDGEENWRPSGKLVLMHEYTHHILNQFSPIQYPRWYDEGFADFMSMVEFDGDDAVIGLPALHRAPILKARRNWLRAWEIIDSRGRYIGNIGSNRPRDPRHGLSGTMVQNAQGWLMVHYLHSKPELQRGIGPYLMAINRADVDDNEAFEQAFGMDLRQFDREVRRYWEGAELAVGRVEIASRLPPIEPEVRVMPQAEVEAIGYESAIMADSISSIPKSLARKAFEQSIAGNIRVEDMRLSLIEMALAEQDWPAARRQIDLLLEADSESAPALTAEIRLQRLQHEDEFDTETALALRDKARTAIARNPYYVPALMQYADLTFEHDLELDRNVGSIVESIRLLAPGLIEGQVFEARLFARNGDVDEAIAILDALIKWSRSPGQAATLREIREELADQA